MPCLGNLIHYVTGILSFPPPTAIAGGLLAAIVGLDNGSSSDPGRLVWTAMSGTQVALSILKPIKWYSTAINLLYFKSAAGELGKHIQSKHQLVKNPRYRIYISGGPIYSELKNRLAKGECVYTPPIWE